MTDEGTDGPDLPEEVLALIREVHLQHPFWSYERIAEYLHAAGHPISAFAVSWIHGQGRLS